MITPVLAVNMLLETAGLVAAILIALFFFVSILLWLIVATLSTVVTGWLEEKALLLKLLRPNVESFTEAHQAVERGETPDESQSVLVRTVATMPGRVQALDQKVERASDRVVGTVIELRARTMQVKTVVKAFLLPGLMRRQIINDRENDPEDAEKRRLAYRRLMREAEEAAMAARREEAAQAVHYDNREQRKDVPTH